MTQQLELPFRTRKTKPDTARIDADLLIDVLRKRPELQRKPASTMVIIMGWKDRRLRAAAEAAEGLILSAPGATGYRLAEATPVESYYAIERAAYLSQIQLMQKRLCSMDRAVHGAKK